LRRNLLLILFIIFFINSCSYSKNIENTFSKVKKTNFILLKFDSAIEKIISEMLKPNHILIFNKKLFFIDLIENQTNIFIDREKITDLIKHKISIKNNDIHFLEKNMIKKNKKKIGILEIKKTLDTSTAIFFSRNNNVEYYIHSCISGKNEPFLLKIELILVKTGEIVFMKEERCY